MSATSLHAPPTQRDGTPALAEHRHAAPARAAVSMIGALPPWRGVAPYTKHLLDALEDVDAVDVEFIDFSSLYPPRLYPGGAPRDPHGRPPAFRRTRVRRLLAWYNPLSWLRAGLTLRGSVVHAQWWSYALAPVYAVVLGLARLRGKRVVLTLHNIDPHETSGWQRGLFRSVFRFADHFIVHSQRNAETLVRTYPRARGRVSVVPLGLHTVAARRQIGRAAARRELGMPADLPVVLALGNIRPYKGIDGLLRAFRLLVESGPEATLAIAGQPWGSFEPYERLIEQLGLGGRVRTWLEYVPEEQVETFFAAADLAVFPYTHFDAQSAAGALALSFGVPLLVTDVGGLPDLVADPRAVVPPNDAAGLAAAMRAVLTDGALRAKLADDSRRKEKELTWSAIAAKTTALYAQLLREGRKENGLGVVGT
jgi:glycosyltransferase involved in cell wall biosynthesis